MRFLLSGVLLAASMVTGFAVPRYTITDLGTLGGATSSATAINNSGQIVGTAALSTGNTHAFLYADGAMTDLGTLGGANSYANAINNLGQVAGVSETGAGNHGGFRYASGTMANFGISASEGLRVAGINDKGEIVYSITTQLAKEGYSSTACYLYSGGKVKNLTKGMSDVFAIDAKGRVLGSLLSKNDTFSARLYDRGKFLPLAALGRVSSFPEAINDQGEIAGSVKQGGSYFPFVYLGGKINWLSKKWRGSATAINNAGMAVGSMNIQGTNYAFSYFPGHSNPVLLRDSVNFSPTEPFQPDWQFTNAAGINDRGEIVGDGINPAGQHHAFLLTPGTSVLISGEQRGVRRTTRASRLVIRGWTFGPVARVTHSDSLNGVLKPVQGTTRWHFTARLKPGRNNITVIATGPAGTTDYERIQVRRRK